MGNRWKRTEGGGAEVTHIVLVARVDYWPYDCLNEILSMREPEEDPHSHMGMGSSEAMIADPSESCEVGVGTGRWYDLINGSVLRRRCDGGNVEMDNRHGGFGVVWLGRGLTEVVTLGCHVTLGLSLM